MSVKPIARSYWRLIKYGNRTFDSVSDNVKEDVLTLAKHDVETGVITSDQYLKLTGKEYK